MVDGVATAPACLSETNSQYWFILQSVKKLLGSKHGLEWNYIQKRRQSTCLLSSSLDLRANHKDPVGTASMA
jgi:hypothetical protein